MSSVVIAPDKFRGSATARQICEAVAEVVVAHGRPAVQLPMADGGEGTVDAFGGANRSTLVTGPLGDPVDAGWRLMRPTERRGQFAEDVTAIIEMATASGLDLVGGHEGNDPLAASTFGTGELIAEAVDRGATRVVIGLGGSATTDGGLGALRAMYPVHRYRGVDLVVATDVRTRFVDAAAVFGPQKGATPAQIKLLTRRLERLAQVYEDEHGVDVRNLAGAGAAGGLAGGLAAIGADLVSGFDFVADEVGLEEAIESASLVVTGEGAFDQTSLDGKVVGGVAAIAARFEVPVLVVAGAVAPDVELPTGVTARSVSAEFGVDASMANAPALVAAIVDRLLGAD